MYSREDTSSVIGTLKDNSLPWIKFSIDETWHVAWVVHWCGIDHFRHAIGDGVAGNRVTDNLAELRFTQSKYHSIWLPILFPQRALMDGSKSLNCVTAAIRALLRGWIYIP